MIDLTAFRKALLTLEAAIVRSKTDLSDDILRDAVIQRFEYCYELSWKLIKRQLEQDLPSTNSIDAMSFKELIREACERGLVEQFETWMEYRYARNKTSHSYNEKNAEEVYQAALNFYHEALQLLQTLEKRNAHNQA